MGWNPGWVTKSPHALDGLKVPVKISQSCLALCNPMDYTVHGIPQARILEWVDFPFSRGSSQPRNRTQLSHIAGEFLTIWATRILEWVAYPFSSGSSWPRNHSGVSCLADRLVGFSSVQFSCSALSDYLQPHGPQHTRSPSPSPTPRAHPNPCPSSRWCHPTILSSVIPFCSWPNPFQHQGLFQWVSSSHEVAKVLEFQL